MVRQIRPKAADEFKSAYSLGFLGLTQDHSEADLHGALLRDLGRFIQPAKQISRNHSGFIARLSLYRSITTSFALERTTSVSLAIPTISTDSVRSNFRTFRGRKVTVYEVVELRK